jgi:uncharacterized RDD family membrane protein YckC
MSSAEDYASTPASNGSVSSPRAGFWLRFGAGVIDGIVLAIPSFVLQAALKGAGSLLAILVGAIYFTVMVGGPAGQTVGMKGSGIRVLSIDGSGSIGYGRAAIRWIGGYISTIPIFLGFLWMLWDKEKQCWHDKMASDVVVRT